MADGARCGWCAPVRAEGCSRGAAATARRRCRGGTPRDGIRRPYTADRPVPGFGWRPRRALPRDSPSGGASPSSHRIHPASRKVPVPPGLTQGPKPGSASNCQTVHYTGVPTLTTRTTTPAPANHQQRDDCSWRWPAWALCPSPPSPSKGPTWCLFCASQRLPPWLASAVSRSGMRRHPMWRDIRSVPSHVPSREMTRHGACRHIHDPGRAAVVRSANVPADERPVTAEIGRNQRKADRNQSAGHERTSPICLAWPGPAG